MSHNKIPEQSNDDIIISEHAKRLMEQERRYIATERPMEKLELLFKEAAPSTNFMTRVNGAGQFSIYRAGDIIEDGTHIMLSARVLSPCMGDSATLKPIISMRFSIQIKDTRFYFARLAAIKKPNGRKLCAVCAIRSNNLKEYYFEDPEGIVYTGGNLDLPITADDLMAATKLDKADLISAIQLSYKLLANNIDTSDILRHLSRAVEKLDF